jgi:hypothetical protein
MKRDPYFFLLYNRGKKAHIIASEQYNNKKYLECMRYFILSNYYDAVAYALTGSKSVSAYQKEGIHTPNGTLNHIFDLSNGSYNRLIQSVKKLGKEDRSADIQSLLDSFIAEITPDLIFTTAKISSFKSYWDGLSTWEKIEKNLSGNAKNPFDPIDKLMLGDPELMKTLRRLKSAKSIDFLMGQMRSLLEVGHN